MPTSTRQVTRILQASREGDAAATEQLLGLVYEELRALARSFLLRERVDHTLQPTALVHEAYLRMVHQEDASFESRAHFVRVAARVIRRVLIDHARRRATQRRGAGLGLVPLEETVTAPSDAVDLLELDEALGALEQRHPRQKQVVELRYFGGLTLEETARVLQVSTMTVKTDWALARAWLHRYLSEPT